MLLPLTTVPDVEPRRTPTRRQWRYTKVFDVVTGDIWVLHRSRGSQGQVLREGAWRNISGEDEHEMVLGTDQIELTPIERRNLFAFLSTGQTDVPARLDLEPNERYRKWKCPDCETFTVVPVISGLPTEDDGEASREGHIILQGCIVFGDEPSNAVACTTCGWFGEVLGGRKIRHVPRPEAFRRSFDDFEKMDQ